MKRQKGKYLFWLISAVRDACRYNKASEMCEHKLSALEEALGRCEMEGLGLTKSEYEAAVRRMVESGLSLLPNTEKVTRSWGVKEGPD